MVGPLGVACVGQLVVLNLINKHVTPLWLSSRRLLALAPSLPSHASRISSLGGTNHHRGTRRESMGVIVRARVSMCVDMSVRVW